MRRALYFFALAASCHFLSGCGGVTSVEIPRANQVNEQNIDLDVCVFSPNPYYPSYLFSHNYMDGSRPFFRSVSQVASLNDAKKCDLAVKMTSDGASAFARSYADVYSVYSRKHLIRAESGSSTEGALAGLGTEVFEKFQKGTPLYDQVVAERLEYRKRQDSLKTTASGGLSKGELQEIVQAAVKGAGQQTNAPPSKSIFSSDVDSPKYKNAENPNGFAIVVGVEKYSNNLPEAQFAERDAQSMRDHLIGLGFPPRQIKLLNGNQATKANFEAYLEEWLSRNVKENSRVFFYYSGHGAPDPTSGQAYLVLYDGNPEFLGKTGYPIKKLYNQLNSLKAKEIIVALDSCFSGSGGRSVLAQGIKPLVTKVDEGLPATDKMVIFSASAGNEISGTMEEQGHGAFTYYFLKGLNGEGKDASGQITAKSLYNYLKPKVQDAASLQNRDQTPQLMPAVLGEQSALKLR